MKTKPAIYETWAGQARKIRKRILLAEALDERVLTAAVRCHREQLADPVLLGDAKEIHALAETLGFSASELPEIMAGPTHLNFPQLCEIYAGQRAEGRPPNLKSAARILSQPVYLAAMMLGQDWVDGVVAGAVTTTADVVRAARYLVGLNDGVTEVSSCFVMAGLDPTMGHEGNFVFADCGATIAPDAEQLAGIALAAAQCARQLLGCEPKVAFLSFSTKGSASHEKVDVVKAAVAILHERDPGFMFDGELQVDAALVPEIARRKAPGSPLKGQANVLVFPDLNSGNIGYKLVERLAGAWAVGPIIQGLKRPMCDLSRGCKIEDIENAITLMSLMSGRDLK